MINHHHYKILIIQATTLLVLLTGCHIEATPEEVLEKAVLLIDQQKTESALKLLRPFVYHHQDNFKAHFLLGKAFYYANADNDKSLYLARYYFNKSRDLAENANQREKAARMYADAKLLMGKGGQSGEILLETAIVAADLGRKSQAVRLSIQAATRFIEQDEYKDAQEACRFGLKFAETKNQESDLKIGLATAYFFEEKYTESFDTLSKIPLESKLDHQISRVTALEKDYLLNAVHLMMLKPQRNKWAIWKKEFDNNTKKQFKTHFSFMVTYIKDNQSTIGQKRGKLTAESCLIVAEFAKNNGMPIESRQAYEFARSLYSAVQMEKEALSVAEKLRDLEG
jgi:tetratricopeptide (TPR) repeat protein